MPPVSRPIYPRLAHCGMALLAFTAVAQESPFVLARGGRTDYTIVHATDADESEKLAVSELVHYLRASTGAAFPVHSEPGPRTSGPRILVGPSAAARALVGAEVMDSLGEEELLVRTIMAGQPPQRSKPDLLLAGGRPRGTLYAVYSFLENEVGCRWLTIYGDDAVPERDVLTIPHVDRRERPVFRHRFIYMLCWGDPKLQRQFMLRNRLNGSGSDPDGPFYRLASPTVHTLFYYINPAEEPNAGYGAIPHPETNNYLVTHPEYFSLFSGKRVARQLCFTNPELRNALTAAVEQRVEQVGRTGVFSISAQDQPGEFCQCAPCRELVRKHGTPAAPLFAYLVEIGTAFAEKYPDVYVSTLAYRKDQSEKPPADLVFPDNIIIRFAPIDDNFAAPLSHPSNRGTLANLREWSTRVRHLWVWYYTNPYGGTGALPIGNLHRMAADFRTFAEIGVEGFTVEHDSGVPQSHLFGDLQTWLLAKLMWDPKQDCHALVADFTDRFYGPASALMREYTDALEEATRAMPTSLIWSPGRGEYRYLTPAFLSLSQTRFDRMKPLVADDPVRLLRVKQARMSLDRACIAFWDKLENLPDHGLDREAIGARYRRTYEQTLARRVLARNRPRLAGYVDDFVRDRLRMTPLKPVPPPLASLPEARLRQVVPVAGSQPDPDAAAGVARSLDTNGELPLTCGFYDLTDRKFLINTKVLGTQVRSGGYNLYRIGRARLNQQCYVWVTASWRIQVRLGEHFEPDAPDREVDIYASLRFEGPSYPHGDGGEIDRVYVDRVVLVTAD